MHHTPCTRPTTGTHARPAPHAPHTPTPAHTPGPTHKYCHPQPAQLLWRWPHCLFLVFHTPITTFLPSSFGRPLVGVFSFRILHLHKRPHTQQHPHHPPHHSISILLLLQKTLPGLLGDVQALVVERANAAVLQLLYDSSLSDGPDGLDTALRSYDVAARPLFVPGEGDYIHVDHLLLAVTGMRIQECAVQPCPALKGKKGATRAADVLTRSAAFAAELAGHLGRTLSALEAGLTVALTGEFSITVSLNAALPSLGSSGLAYQWVQHVESLPAFERLVGR
jgi:hypothetical protein